MITYMAAFLCVLGLAIGQVLFKLSATALAQSGSFFNIKTVVTLLAAICLYGITSVAWIWVLQRIELGRVYPLMALAFVLIPLCSYIVFDERFQPQYFVGIAFIIIGIIIAVRA